MTKPTDPVDYQADFGFSFVDTESTEKIITDTQQQIEQLQQRIELLYATIAPFLDNLCKDPDKATIHWPNRVEKIQQFKKRLRQITDGKGDKK
jgi:hypothetical protein